MYRGQVTIRHFSANNYINDKDPSAVWNGVSQRSNTKSVLKQIKKNPLVKHNVHLQMGNNITCTIDPTTLAPTDQLDPRALAWIETLGVKPKQTVQVIFSLFSLP